MIKMFYRQQYIRVYYMTLKQSLRAIDSLKNLKRIMTHLEYTKDKTFKDVKKIDYEDVYIKMKGELISNKLYDINDSETIMKKIINPSLDLYRK